MTEEQRRVLNGAIGDAIRQGCRHPKAYRRWLEDGGSACLKCGKDIPAEASRKGRRARRRGNDVERDVAKKLGLHRVGQYGTAVDVGNINEPFAIQVKSGGYFSERYWLQLSAAKQHATASQTGLFVVTDAKGPGHARRAMVVLDLADWIALHGLSGVAEVRE